MIEQREDYVVPAEVVVPGVGNVFATDVVVYDGVDTSIGGREHLEEADYGPLGRFKIVNQPDYPFDGATPGKIAHTALGTQYEVLVIVVLEYLPNTRAWWPEEMAKDNVPFCYSDNYMNPAVPTEFRPMSERLDGPCATCEMSQWEDGESGNRIPPRCNKQRNFLIAAIDDQTQQIVEGTITFQKSMIPDARKLTSIADKTELRGSILMILYLYENDRGFKWYRPAFKAFRPLDRAAQQHFSTLRKNLLARFESGELVVQAETAPDVETDEAPAPTTATAAPPSAPEEKPARKRRSRKRKEAPPPMPEEPPTAEEWPFEDEGSIPF